MFFFSSRRRHTRFDCDWSSDVCSSDLDVALFDKTVGNPQSRIPEAIGVLHDQAPQLHLRLHVASIQAIERGLMEGRWQVGVLPSAPSSGALDSARLFGERMQLYCAPGHPLHGADHDALDWDSLGAHAFAGDRKSTRLNSSHSQISYAVFCLKKKKNTESPPY